MSGYIVCEPPPSAICDYDDLSLDCSTPTPRRGPGQARRKAVPGWVFANPAQQSCPSSVEGNQASAFDFAHRIFNKFNHSPTAPITIRRQLTMPTWNHTQGETPRHERDQFSAFARSTDYGTLSMSYGRTQELEEPDLNLPADQRCWATKGTPAGRSGLSTPQFDRGDQSQVAWNYHRKLPIALARRRCRKARRQCGRRG